MQLTGHFLDYFIVFWAGVLVSFTPCVYPVMPITATFIAGMNTQGTKLRGFILSLIYVLGLAISYCALAVFAALTGKIFGQVQNQPLVFIIVANILIVFALMMFDVIPIPNIGVNFQNKIKARNIWTVILFGMAAGFIIGPCTAPVLATLLLYIASHHNFLHGLSLTFVFSYGVGASLIVVGTFSGVLASFPKSGQWLVWIKRLCGLILLGAGEYFLVKAGSLLF